MNLADATRMMGAEPPAGVYADLTVTGYSIDSRTAREGELFFALKGERHDGHAYVGDVMDRGALAAVVEHLIEGVQPERQVQVADSLAALQRLAQTMLAEWGGPIVGVTGSAGKTTTKDLTACVLSAAGPTHKSIGNFNNAYGLPKSVLDMATDGRNASDYRFCVLEMGMSTPGEIRRLTELAPPSVGVVTIVAPVHTEFFEDGIEGVARAKGELIDGLLPNGTAVLNADDERVARMAAIRSDIRVIQYGFSQNADITARDVASAGLSGSRFRLETPAGAADVALPLVGRHNIANALAAAGAGLALGLSPDQIAEALATSEASNKRGQVVRLANGATVLDDSYNSSPRALEAMTATLAGLDGTRRIVVAGEMLELGPQSAEMHRESGRIIAQSGVDMLVGVRGNARALVEGARAAGMRADATHFVETPEAAAELLAETIGQGDLVLVKGSRGVATDRVVTALKNAIGVGGGH